MSDVNDTSNLHDDIKSRLSNIKFTHHAFERFFEQDIDVSKFEESIQKRYQIIEEYEDDPRGDSALILIKVDNQFVHAVVSPHNDELIVISGYLPNESLWEDNFTRRKK